MKLICPQGYSMPSYAACSGNAGKKEEVVKAWDAGTIVVPSDGTPGQSGQLSSAASNHKEWLRTATETYEVEYEEVSLSFHVAVLSEVLHIRIYILEACGSSQQRKANCSRQSTETQVGNVLLILMLDRSPLFSTQ